MGLFSNFLKTDHLDRRVLGREKNMKRSLVVTFSGPDRTGLVETLAKTISQHGGNWEEGRLCRLAGRFAGLVEVTATGGEQQLAEAICRLEDVGLSISVAEGVATQRSTHGTPIALTLTGADHPGIVSQVARCLANLGINIEEMSTSRKAAPMSGEELFSAEALIRCPPDLSLDQLRQSIELLADDLVVEISLTPSEPASRP